MTFSLRLAGLACGVFAVWGLVGCDTAETTASVASNAASTPITSPAATQNPELKNSTVLVSSAGVPSVSADVENVGNSAPPAGESNSAVATTAPPKPVVPAPSAPAAPADRPRMASKVTGKPGEIQEVTFDTIKLPMEKDQPFQRSLLTPEVVALDGRPIRIRGYILPSFQQTGITQFVLVRDNLQCCFGPGAALFDCIIVEMKSGKSADYTVRPVSVEGKFTLAEMVNPDDGKHLAIYHLDGDKVQ